MKAKFEALRKNMSTWELIPRLPANNVINDNWVFKVKQNKDGSMERYKARLVANGMLQIKGTDYTDTFSLVVHPLLIRLVLTLAITQNWKLHQVDVSNAFLYGLLDERIVASRPNGFQNTQFSEHVCLL